LTKTSKSSWEKGFTDLHVHILPNIDDGPQSVEESVLLAGELVKYGFDTVVATPHFIEGAPSNQEIWRSYRFLVNELEQRDIPLQVLPGAEITLDSNLLKRAEDGKLVSLGGDSNWLLLELPLWQPAPDYLEDYLFELNATGYGVIIAHPERVQEFQHDLDRLYRLVYRGALCQVTLGSLTGLFGKSAHRTAWKAMQCNLVHLVTTDCHRPGKRLQAVPQALSMLNRYWRGEAIELWLKKHPQKILQGEDLEFYEPLLPSRKTWKDLFGRLNPWNKVTGKGKNFRG